MVVLLGMPTFVLGSSMSFWAAASGFYLYDITILLAELREGHGKAISSLISEVNWTIII